MSEDLQKKALGRPADWPRVGILTMGHVLGDGFVSFHLVLMPLLAEKLGLTTAAVGAVVGAATLMGSLAQPACGHLCEHRDRRYFMSGGLALSILGAGLLGLSWSYASLAAFLLLAKAGLATYHPAGAALASDAAGDRRGAVLSLYSSAGNFGVMLGPALLGFAVDAWDVGVTVWAIPLGLVLLVPTAFLAPVAAAASQAREASAMPTRKRPFAILAVHMTLRNLAITGTLTYLPFYCRNVLLMERRSIGLVVALFTLSGVVGTFLAGHLSDLWRRRPILVWSPIVASPLLLAFLAGVGPVPLALMAFGSAFLWAGHTIDVVLGQEYLPRNQSLASGITLGLTWGVASMALPLWGWIGDVRGEGTALMVLATIPPFLTGLSALLLTHTERHEQVECLAEAAAEPTTGE